MKKRTLIITLCTIALIGGGLMLSSSVVHAQTATAAQTTGTATGAITPPSDTGSGSLWSIFGLGLVGFVDNMVAVIFSLLLWVMSWWVTITGALLNVSIVLTLHIKDFVNGTQGVYLVWQTIRDISGIFIIFVLLYVSFLLILGQDSKTLGSPETLIKNIVIAGILINFSFFITSLLIDASNIVSMALYNGIVGTQSTNLVQAPSTCLPAPASAGVTPAGGLSTCGIISNTLTGTNGGLGDVFMQKLSIQSLYTPGSLNLNNVSSNASYLFSIILQGIAGCIIMFTTGFSFLLASLAFVARLIILIVLLAFSPIWFAAMIFPVLKDKAKHFTDHLYSQLVFMPVYLLLMYAALTVLTKSTVFTNPTVNAVSSIGGASWIPVNLIVLLINDFFIIFLLNLPLITAFTMGGATTDLFSGAVKKFNAANVWKNTGQQSAQGAWRNTGGRVASRVARSDAFQTFAGKSIIGEAALKATRAAGKDFDAKLDKRVKSREEFGKSLNRAGATAYADRLTTSFPTNVINSASMMGTIGRANRVAAASILTTRAAEVKTDLDKLTSELRKHQKAAAAGRTLTTYEQDRVDKLTGANLGGNNSINPKTGVLNNEIDEAQSDLTNIQNQINNFQTNIGASAKDTTKRKY